jgi:hypothetical protein
VDGIWPPIEVLHRVASTTNYYFLNIDILVYMYYRLYDHEVKMLKIGIDFFRIFRISQFESDS